MADINYSQLIPEQAGHFKSHHWVHTEVANNRHLVTITGIAKIDYKGTSRDRWRRDRLLLGLKFPTSFIPRGKWFQIEHWAPFVTINAIFNEDLSRNAGWAVDEFGLSRPTQMKVRNSVGIWARIGVRDSDGKIIRVGYSLTVSGVISDPPPPVT